MAGTDGTPTRVHDTRFEEVTTGFTHTCGVDLMRKRVSCWGTGMYGQLGNGTQNSAIPIAAGLIVP
jgi:alpha-tubulin suppressor-like RCC1 family protein